MKKMYQYSFEDELPGDDDIDELFSHMEKFTPPADFVNRVMDAVSKLPLPQYIPQPVETDQPEEYKGLVVHHQRQVS